MLRRPTIFLGDDHTRFCDVVAATLHGEFDVVGMCHDPRAVVAQASRLPPDIIVLDVSMSLLTGIDLATRLGATLPTAVVLFAAIGEVPPVAARAVRIGAHVFLVHTPAAPALGDAIWSVLDEIQGSRETGGNGVTVALTRREKEVVQLLAEGKLMKQVADLLNVSPRTVAFHKYGVMRKLGLRSNAELFRLAVAQGLVA